MTQTLFRIGFIINPIAGMGGKVGLRGTDGDLYEKARLLGAVPISCDRARRTLISIQDIKSHIEVLATGGQMGYDLAVQLGFSTTRILSSFGGTQSGRETRAAAREMLDAGVDLILFAGGDGTARDIQTVVGEKIPMLGIPTGVKMRSGVFATNPESAGDLVRGFIFQSRSFPLRLVEIFDLAPGDQQSEWPSTEFFGMAKAPYSQLSLQRAKSGAHIQGDAGIDDVAGEFAASLREGSLYLYGPGTTTHKILQAVGQKGSIGGVDASIGKEIIGSDLSESALLDLLGKFSSATLFLSIIGGQGFLLGRGNQQLSARVVDLIKPENIVLLASAEKIGNLFPALLHVDLGDAHVESLLEGYRKVHVAPGRVILCKVVVPTRAQVQDLAV